MKTTILILMAAAITVSAADNPPGTPPDKMAPTPKVKTPNTQLTAKPTPAVAVKSVKHFNAEEFQVDLFGVMSRPNLTTDKPVWGTGVGASYFPWKGLGFGVRAVAYETDDWGGAAFDEGEVRGILRVPLWDRVAPYGFLSGIHNFECDDWGAGAGGGLEFRLNKRFGVFGETGLRVTTEGNNDWSTSAGLRVIF